jgi:hypothetical protein
MPSEKRKCIKERKGKGREGKGRKGEERVEEYLQ